LNGYKEGDRVRREGGRESVYVCLSSLAVKKKHKWPSMLMKWRYILTNETRLPYY
jgi:hypothetical protein